MYKELMNRIDTAQKRVHDLEEALAHANAHITSLGKRCIWLDNKLRVRTISGLIGIATAWIRNARSDIARAINLRGAGHSTEYVGWQGRTVRRQALKKLDPAEREHLIGWDEALEMKASWRDKLRTSWVFTK